MRIGSSQALPREEWCNGLKKFGTPKKMAPKGTRHTMNGTSIVDSGLQESKALVEAALIQNRKQFLTFSNK